MWNSFYVGKGGRGGGWFLSLLIAPSRGVFDADRHDLMKFQLKVKKRKKKKKEKERSERRKKKNFPPLVATLPPILMAAAVALLLLLWRSGFLLSSMGVMNGARNWIQ